MKLTLRPEWRIRPLQSFLGCVDIKTGVLVALAFAVRPVEHPRCMINKVAGVYGLVAVLTGAGGSAAQLSLYLYSSIALAAFVWGLRAIAQEDPKYTLYFAHLFAADHVLNTAWTVFFAVVWWVYTPHDGRRQANSPAQEAMAKAGAAQAAKIHNMTQQEREVAAMDLWNHEKGTATAVIVIGWLAKIYFALLIYSYAVHLRKGSYRSLPTSRPSPQSRSLNPSAQVLPDDDDDLPVEDFYRLPTTPLTANSAHNASAGHTRSALSHARSGSSVGSFADFVSAPGRSSAKRPASKLNPAVSNAGDGVDEVLFDEAEAMEGVASGSRSKRSGGRSASASLSAGEEEDGRGKVRLGIR
ncbi:DUF1753-domain-containing protein [Cristinia sonorae]|uniref:DUF1753-domain-containing protein n=1 Tax=Cristinia sonorae TaxID=1940300 RepID=A0A8K0UTX7_9AGAR|nr:DUF1753-domain-containing protein [Cristinia sonorae]